MAGCASASSRVKAPATDALGQPTTKDVVNSIRAGRGTVIFNHELCKADLPAGASACTGTFRRTFRHGESFNIVITNTEPKNFEYVVSGWKLPVSENNGAQRASERETKTLWQVHDRQFGGYIVEIRPRALDGLNATKLAAATLRIDVETAETKVAFAGGFTFSSLVDPPFALKEEEVPATAPGGTATTQTRLIEQDSRRDKMTRGMGSFVHLWHTRLPDAALSFGLGLETGGTATYYAGPSWRLGDKGFLSAGYLLGSVKSMPAGVELNGIVKDANVLANAGTRTQAGWFFGLSYAFIGSVSEALAKPFAAQKSAPPNSANTDPESADPRPCTRSAMMRFRPSH